MIFAMRFSVTAMLCCVLVHRGKSEELSNIALDLVQVLSGYYDNKEQIEKGDSDEYFVQDWYIPVNVPVFGSKIVFLVMEAVKGTFARVELHVVSSLEGDLIKITAYNFTDPNLYKPGQFPFKVLDHLTLSQLHTDPDCVLGYVRADLRVFTTEWPDCKVTVNGKHPSYSLTFNCDRFYAVTPIAAQEHGHMYNMRRKGGKYKLVNAPDNYVGPCDKQP